MTARVKKYTNDRITIDALKYYIPLYHIGFEAQELLNNGNYLEEDYYSLKTKAQLKYMVILKIAYLSGPLITKEINKIISTSHLKYTDDDIFDILYYAGIDGMTKGLKHFNVDKINISSTNYLFQWITTYAKKELSNLEAPEFGIAPSRFTKYKKIAAVRKKLTIDLGEYADNFKVYNYFQSGQADVKTLNGKVNKKNEPYQSNKNITLELIEEQEKYELNLSSIELLEDTSHNVNISKTVENKKIFEETIFGIFTNNYNFTDSALAVLKSELDVDITSIEEDLLHQPSFSYRSTLMKWNDLFRDKNGVFYDFLLDYIKENPFHSDALKCVKAIENYDKKIIKSLRYSDLFIDKKIQKRGF